MQKNKWKNKDTHDIGKLLNNLDGCDHEYWIVKGIDECQHADSDSSSSMQLNGNEKKPWYCQKFYFTPVHKLTNWQHATNWFAIQKAKEAHSVSHARLWLQDVHQSLLNTGLMTENPNNLLHWHKESLLCKQVLIHY